MYVYYYFTAECLRLDVHCVKTSDETVKVDSVFQELHIVRPHPVDGIKICLNVTAHVLIYHIRSISYTVLLIKNGTQCEARLLHRLHSTNVLIP